MVCRQNVDRQKPTDIMSTDKMSNRQNVDRQNAERTKCWTDKMSNGQNVEQTKCRTDKMSNRQNVEQTKCQTDKMSNGQNVERTKCRTRKMPTDKMSTDKIRDVPDIRLPSGYPANFSLSGYPVSGHGEDIRPDSWISSWYPAGYRIVKNLAMLQNILYNYHLVILIYKLTNSWKFVVNIDMTLNQIVSHVLVQNWSKNIN